MVKRINLALPGLLALLVAPSIVNAQDTAIDETIATMQKWVETERIISEEKNEWEVEKATLQDLIRINEDEIELIQEQIESTEEVATQADRQRAELLEEKDRLKEAADIVAQQLVVHEAKTRALIKLLPDVLKKEIDPLIQRLPEEGEKVNMSIAQRMQNIVGILTQVDKFNNAVSVVSDLREFGNGSRVQVKTIFFGLGGAYYADESMEHAGIGTPTADGWVWTENPDYAQQIKDAIEIYENTQQARYINLPVNVKTK